ncbi:MAG: hypothetical protein V2I33_04600 [Kangiellaceae bacterium]|jgi:hypothetical protein|nr:hypothetical protein [Kangiellaceae bacterium]
MKNTDQEITEMAHYGITCEQTPIYRYKQFKYEKLLDAINFAKLDRKHDDATISGDDHTALASDG